jgi:HEAT repeat protein
MVLQGVVLLLTLAQAAPPRAQAPAPPPRPPASAPAPAVKDADAAALATGWNAYVSGQIDVAVKTADALLQRRPWDHAAAMLRIHALSKAVPDRGLDAYEQWLKRSRVEDAGMLEPVAIAVLQQIVAGARADLRTRALRALAQSRVAGAREALAADKTGEQAQIDTDVTAARGGDAEAVQRLNARASAGGSAALAEAFAGLGVSAGEPGLLLLAKSQNPQTRAAAVEGLGGIKSDAARTAATAARRDSDPVVRTSATIALARMGDQTALADVDRMLNSNVPDVQVTAARAWEGRPGPWVAVLRPLLDNPDGLTRLEAARAIAPVDPDAARRVFNTALGDTNPVIRYESAKALSEMTDLRLTGEDIASLRARLRDGDPLVRLSAASAILRTARE